jgi:uncharacterized protein (DUF1015 family)
MAIIQPFGALRPRKDVASRVATLPYDVCSAEEARKYRHDPFNFYHVTRSEIDLSPNIDVHKPAVYEQAAENLGRMIEEGIFIKDKEPCYYIYRLIFKGREQTGLTCVSSIDDYNKGIIKKHEFTRPEKEKDRIDHIKVTHAQTGVVFLAYKNVAAIDKIIEDWKTGNEPVYDFVSEDEVQHTVWLIDNYGIVSNITDIFDNDVPATYIADGHHRAASAAKVAADYKEQGLSVTGNESFNYFLTCIFPDNQVEIMDYNRAVKDLNNLDVPSFLEMLKTNFEVDIIGQKAYRPQKPHEFGMYISNHWYKVTAKPGSFPGNDPIRSLDVSILQENILSGILGIHDPRRDDRIAFIGGIRGLEELKRRVDSGEMAVAFSCFPVSLEELFNVADSGAVMPPKSTWFEPKTRDGLIIHLI